jgi:hypothetical protein
MINVTSLKIADKATIGLKVELPNSRSFYDNRADRICDVRFSQHTRS